jgi:subtilisin-like proprotein convertase family protein
MTPTDPLYASQWHFPLIGNIQRIWDEYSGAGVHVGVYDEGVDYNHPDLNGNYDASRHVLDNLGNVLDPFPAGNNAHGTACAGIIGAESNNGIGGTGVASGVSLTGVNIFSGGFGDVNGVAADFFFVVSQATNFDISSNSWGATPTYTTGLADGGFADLLEDEYFILSQLGRGFLGTIITQAAGNDTLDANGDGVNASRFTITVSATEQTGITANYSNFGACILVAAPAAAVTTDISGANGYDLGDYTTTFNGTSAATPVVSGVIALMLQANPNLGWRDVQNILANSASHTGSAFGGPKNFDEHGVWGFNSANNWNGGGMHVQTDYGYGMINAYNAVRMAEVWGLFGAAQSSANEQTATSNLNNLGGLAVPDNNPAGVSFNLSVGTSLQIEHVQLVMSFAHTFVGDLKITLTSAEGTTIVVALNSNTNTSFNGQWVFGIDSLRGEISAGTWTVNVADMLGGDTGTLASGHLVVYGSTPGVGDVYHITDEYLAMKALSATRGTIADTNGGTDWIEFSTVAGNIILNLNSGSAFSVNGVNWGALGATTVIENAIGGDGNDTLTGNSSNNILRGMRGNDTLNGGAGADDMFGGAGNDIYYVDNALDKVTEAAGGGSDRILASVTYVLAAGQSVETLTTTNTAGLGAINLTGNAFAQIMHGNGGANILNGGGGIDTMVGFGGSDQYYVDVAGDIVTEAVGGGSDRVFASVSYALAAGQEIEILTTTNAAGLGAINLTGNAFGQTIQGNAGVNVLNGGGGSDTMVGFGGNDQYYVDAAGDIVTEAAGGGSDRVFASASYVLTAGQEVEVFTTTNTAGLGAINLTGNAFNQTMHGNGGANVLNGGAGNDVISGFGGADIFVFNTALNAATNHDTITDFNVAADTIHLENAIFTLLTATGGMAAGLFRDLSLGAQDADDVVIYNRATGDLFYDANGLTAGGQTLFADVTNGLALTAADFFVI